MGLRRAARSASTAVSTERLGIDDVPAPPAAHHGERPARLVLDGDEGRALPAPPVAVERDLAEAEAARGGIGLQPLEQRRLHAVVQRRPELEAFGVGQHAEHAGQRILAGPRDQDGRGRTEQDDVAQALSAHARPAPRRSPASAASAARRLASRLVSAAAMRQAIGADELAQRGRREPGQQGLGVDRLHIVVARDLGADLVGEDEARRGRRGLGAAAGGIAQDRRCRLRATGSAARSRRRRRQRRGCRPAPAARSRRRHAAVPVPTAARRTRRRWRRRRASHCRSAAPATAPPARAAGSGRPAPPGRRRPRPPAGWRGTGGRPDGPTVEDDAHRAAPRAPAVRARRARRGRTDPAARTSRAARSCVRLGRDQPGVGTARGHHARHGCRARRCGRVRAR